MKTVQVSARLPEKQDILGSFDKLTNDEVARFVCSFEGLEDIGQFRTKTVPTKKFGDTTQMQKTRNSDAWDEFYSGKTCAVYRVSYMVPGGMIFEEIHFKENRPKGIGYGLDANTAKAHAYCTLCNTIISMLPNWLGHHPFECRCNCK